MAPSSFQALPADLFHLISVELSDRLDFSTLYNYAVSSKQLANAGAINALYRISHQAPVKGGGPGGGEGLPFAEQELIMQRWSILWRTITLSALGKTVYPYCRHLRFLDLRDLGHLLDDDKFRGKIAKNFFSGGLAKYHFVQQTPGKGRASRLDTRKIITAIGSDIIQQAPLLEALSEPTNYSIFGTALLDWVPRLSHLTSIDFFDGKSLADETIRNLLHAHCPKLSSLRVYFSANEDADHQLATFIGGMQPNTLAYFENMSDCRIGPETCLALNSHGESLTSLKLWVSGEGVQALALLQGCTSVDTLAIATSPADSFDLKATQNDVYLEIVGWLKECKSLEDISFTNFVSAPDLLLPVLLNEEISLQKLQVNATQSVEGTMYVVKDHHDFHQALSQQPSLRSLLLRANPDPTTFDDMETLVNAFCALKDLRELKLWRISESFRNEHIAQLARHLPNLEDLVIGGGLTDRVFPALTQLKNLKVLTFWGVTSFTESGILDFIEELGEGNSGMLLQIDMAETSKAICQESRDLISEVMATKLDGRFEYQLLRDPNMPDFDDSDEDSD